MKWQIQENARDSRKLLSFSGAPSRATNLTENILPCDKTVCEQRINQNRKVPETRMKRIQRQQAKDWCLEGNWHGFFFVHLRSRENHWNGKFPFPRALSTCSHRVFPFFFLLFFRPGLSKRDDLQTILLLGSQPSQ